MNSAADTEQLLASFKRAILAAAEEGETSAVAALDVAVNVPALLLGPSKSTELKEHLAAAGQTGLVAALSEAMASMYRVRLVGDGHLGQGAVTRVHLDWQGVWQAPARPARLWPAAQACETSERAQQIRSPLNGILDDIAQRSRSRQCQAEYRVDQSVAEELKKALERLDYKVGLAQPRVGNGALLAVSW